MNWVDYALLVVVARRLPGSYTAYASVALVLALSAQNLDSFERYCASTLPFLLAKTGGVGTRHAPHDNPAQIEYFDGHGAFRGLRQVVVNDSAVRWVASGRLVRRNRRIGTGTAPRTHGGGIHP